MRNRNKVSMMGLVVVLAVVIGAWVFVRKGPSAGKSVGSPGTPRLVGRVDPAASIKPHPWGSSFQGGDPAGQNAIRKNNRSMMADSVLKTEKGLHEAGPRGDIRPRIPIALPKGVNLDDIPPWLRDRPEAYLEEIQKVRDANPSEKRDSRNNTVLFINSEPDLVTGYPYSDNVFDPSVIRIYAWFPSEAPVFGQREKVLAKWHREDGSEILFEGMTIVRDTPFNYIWWEEEFWERGKYSVEVYGLEEDIPLLAWGTFEIAVLEDSISFPGLYGDPNDALSRQAFSLDENYFLKLNCSVSEDRQIQLLITTVADRRLIKAGVISLQSGAGQTMVIDLGELPIPFEPGTYVLELQKFPEPKFIVGRNVLKILP